MDQKRAVRLRIVWLRGLFWISLATISRSASGSATMFTGTQTIRTCPSYGLGYFKSTRTLDKEAAECTNSSSQKAVAAIRVTTHREFQVYENTWRGAGCLSALLVARLRRSRRRKSSWESCQKPAETFCPLKRLLICEALNSYKIIYSGFSEIPKWAVSC